MSLPTVDRIPTTNPSGKSLRPLSAAITLHEATVLVPLLPKKPCPHTTHVTDSSLKHQMAIE